MKATTETRQRMILAAVGLMTPVVFWVAFGLFDRMAPRQRYVSNINEMFPTPGELANIQELRKKLVAAGQAENWEWVRKTTDATCGDKCSPVIFPLQAEAYLRLGQPTQAAAIWSKALLWQSPVGQADFLAIKGDRKGYKEFIAPLLLKSHIGESNDAAWACLLLPGIFSDYTPIIKLAEAALLETSTPEGRADTLNTLGVALYRAGRYTEALARLQESEKDHPEMMNIVFSALCYHKIGQEKQARSAADTYYQFLTESLVHNSRNRLEYVLFERELREVLPPKKVNK